MPLDFHVHPWTREFMLRNPPVVKACRFFKLDPSTLPRSIADLTDEMAEADVERAVIFGQDTRSTPNPSFRNYTIDNDHIASLAAKSNGRFVPFAGVDPNSGLDAVRELRRAFVKLEMRGLKVHSSVSSVYPNDLERMGLLYEVCQERGAPVLFHAGTTGLGDCDIKYSKPEFLDEVCQRYPDLKVIIAHFGWPWSDEAIAVALRNPKVYLDLSGWRPRYVPANVLPYLNGILSDRFLFGTDYPMMRQKDWLDDFDANLKPRLKQGVSTKILRGNARKLLGD